MHQGWGIGSERLNAGKEFGSEDTALLSAGGRNLNAYEYGQIGLLQFCGKRSILDFTNGWTMNRKMANLKPAVNKRVLLFLAGFMWLGVGTMLLFLSISWLDEFRVHGSFIFGATGVIVALLVHHFGFLRIVDKNLGRILPMEGTRCVFSFITWKSYIIVAVMVAMGILLRHSPIPKPYLSVLYIGIGLALLLSSVRYLRVLLSQIKEK